MSSLRVQLEELQSLFQAELLTSEQLSDARNSVLRAHGLSSEVAPLAPATQSLFQPEHVPLPCLASSTGLSCTASEAPAPSSSSSSLSFENSINALTLNGTELLIHNVSHSDLVLSVNTHDLSLSPNAAFARPKFSHFRAVTKDILRNIEASASSEGRVQFAFEPIMDADADDSTVRMRGTTPQQSVALGYTLSGASRVAVPVSSLRFRRNDETKVSSSSTTAAEASNSCAGLSSPRDQTCMVEGVYFPLVAVLLPKWIRNILASSSVGSNPRQRVILLISGRGTPMDSTARVVDNSTKFLAELIKNYIACQYPELAVVHVHSTTNIFRYDENIAFVKRELVPLIDGIRDGLSRRQGEHWKDLFGLTLSFADGSSARISAINASLRYYRPTYMHFWQLKTYWSEGRLDLCDIECHSYEVIATEPALRVQQAEPAVQLLVAAMREFIAQFQVVRAMPPGSTDLDSFWLRKTKKPVLAVLLVQKPGGAPKLYRGTNMEVSMPTGSLCAERNVIGSALAADMTLRRQDLKMIAVYSPPSLKESALTPTAVVGELGLGLNGVSNTETGSLLASGAVDVVTFETSPLPVPPAAFQQEQQLAQSESPEMAAGAAATRDKRPRELQEDVSNRDRSVSDAQAQSQGSSQAPLLARSPTAAGGKRKKILDLPGAAGNSGAATNGVVDATSASATASAKCADETTALSSTGCLDSHGLVSASGGATPGQGQGQGQGGEGSSAWAGVSDRSRRLRRLSASPRQRQPFSPEFVPGLTLGQSQSHEQLDSQEQHEHHMLCMPTGSALNTTRRPHASSDGVDGSSPDSSVVTHNTRAANSVIMVSEGDMNPLKPCGACHEWLKKIAEVNPSFTVVTFTDYGCEGVYSEQIWDS